MQPVKLFSAIGMVAIESIRLPHGALGPEVSAGKGAPAVGFYVSRAAGKIYPFPVQIQFPLQRMSHTDDAMGTFHSGKESKRAHDIRPQGSKHSIPQSAMKRKSISFHIQPHVLAGKKVLLHLDPEYLFGSVEFCVRIFQPPCLTVCNDLKRSAGIRAREQPSFV